MKIFYSVLTVALILMNLTIAQPSDMVIEEYSEKGANSLYKFLKNWSEGWMEFEASSTADMSKATNTPHAEYMALEAARALAYERAAEHLGEVAVEATNGIDVGLIHTDILETKVSGIILNPVTLSVTLYSPAVNGSYVISIPVAVINALIIPMPPRSISV